MVSVFLDAITASGLCPLSCRCRLSSNHLHSPGDLSLEFCIYSWPTEMHLLAENTSSSVGRTRERLPLIRLTPLLQPIFAILGCAAMYTDLALGHTYNLIKHAEASGPLHRAHTWNILPFPIFAGCQESPGGNPSHFLVSLLMHLSIASTVGRPISYIVNGHISLGMSTNWTSHTLNLPGRNTPPIASKLSFNIFHVAVSWFLSLRVSSNTLPRLFTGSSCTVGIRWPATRKKTSLRIFPRVSARLLDFAGLKDILHHSSRSFILSRLLWTACFRFITSVVSSMNALIEDVWNFRPICTLSLWDPDAFRRTCIANTKRHMGRLRTPWQFPPGAESTLLYTPSWRTSSQTLWNILVVSWSRVLVHGGSPVFSKGVDVALTHMRSRGQATRRTSLSGSPLLAELIPRSWWCAQYNPARLALLLSGLWCQCIGWTSRTGWALMPWSWRTLFLPHWAARLV